MRHILAFIMFYIVSSVFFSACITDSYESSKASRKTAEEKIFQDNQKKLDVAKKEREKKLAEAKKEREKKLAEEKKKEKDAKISTALNEASTISPNFYTVTDIFFDYANLKPDALKGFNDYISEGKYDSTQRNYWIAVYSYGKFAIQDILQEAAWDSLNYHFISFQDVSDLCSSSSQEAKKTLNFISQSLKHKRELKEKEEHARFQSLQNNVLEFSTGSSMLDFNPYSSFRGTGLDFGTNGVGSFSNQQERATQFELNTGFLDIKPNNYGLGVHSDQFGRPIQFEVIGQPNADTNLLEIKPNDYGLGVHSDQFGRPVKATPGW